MSCVSKEVNTRLCRYNIVLTTFRCCCCLAFCCWLQEPNGRRCRMRKSNRFTRSSLVSAKFTWKNIPTTDIGERKCIVYNNTAFHTQSAVKICVGYLTRVAAVSGFSYRWGRNGEFCVVMCPETRTVGWHRHGLYAEWGRTVVGSNRRFRLSSHVTTLVFAENFLFTWKRQKPTNIPAKGGRGRLAVWHLPRGPVGQPGRWAATSDVAAGKRLTGEG